MRKGSLAPTRRSFIGQASAFGLLASLGGAEGAQTGASSAPVPVQGTASPLVHNLELSPFVDALPLPQRLMASAASVGSHRLRLFMREIHVKVHRDLPPTRIWSYGTDAVSPLIEARSHVPLEIEWVNELPKNHFLPIDYSLHGCGHDVPDVRAVVHVHGARVRPVDDGGPEFWFVPGESRVNHYPLPQDACTLWYHDHAMGINRLNLYAGLFGMFLVRDAHEDALHLPHDDHEVPLILYDRDFTRDGQLSYPTSGDPEHPWVSEFGADALLVNGKIRPFLEVDPTLYRFRVVDAANSRFFRLSFATGDKGAVHAGFTQIGSDQGLLRTAVGLQALTIAPGERVDLLFDFERFAGESVTLRNGAFDILQFKVRAHGSSNSHTKVQAAVRNVLPDTLRDIQRMPEASATVTRRITLNEYQDPRGNSMRMLLNRMRWHEPVTEKPRLDSVEIWEFINLTEDTHPMHLHLVRFQILDRRPFDRFAYLMNKELRYVAPAEAPPANEMGWKDVVQCDPLAVTRVIVRFEGFPGKYLYHCHIQEHEANDMMRPYEVVA